ncbi:hypothetical protein RB195_017936 [Necator americanus]|uniref:Synaptophysin / synaptoporin n=1 Tax=Necator americanus TaxID=51031 RepID=A0ABR1C9U9_NECAM
MILRPSIAYPLKTYYGSFNDVHFVELATFEEEDVPESNEAFGPDSVISFTIFVLNTMIVALAMYGIFAFKPIFLTPNVIAKVSLSSAALFHGLQEAESNDSASVFHFLWLLISVCLFIWEIHAMFSATFGVMKEMKLRAYSKPPPSYNQVIADEAPPPSYAQAIERLNTPVVLNVTTLESQTKALQASNPEASSAQMV